MAFPRTDDSTQPRALTARAFSVATLVALLLVALPAAAVKPDPPEISPEAVVSSFYTLCIKESVTGLPTDDSAGGDDSAAGDDTRSWGPPWAGEA